MRSILIVMCHSLWRENTTTEKETELRDLVSGYAEEIRLFGQASEDLDPKASNRAHKRIQKVLQRILDHGEAGTEALVELMDHDNPWVRRLAAGECFQFSPKKAERVLKGIIGDGGRVSMGVEFRLLRLKEGEEFVRLAKDLGEASEERDSQTAEHLTDLIAELSGRLIKRGLNGRTVLSELNDHEDPWVRLVSAGYCLDIPRTYERARKALETLMQRNDIIGGLAAFKFRESDGEGSDIAD